MKNKKLTYIIAGLVVVGLIVGGVSFLTIQANKKEAEIAHQADIKNQLSIMKFDQEILLGQEDDHEKLSSYKYLLSEQKEYKNSEITDKVILDKYKENVTAAKKSFRDNNDSYVERERAEEAKEAEEGEILEERITILGIIKENIEGEQSIMYSKEQKQEAFAKIDTLVKEFKDKINQLKVAKEKKEVEEKLAAEQQAEAELVSQAENKSSSNYSENSISGSSNDAASNNTGNSSSNIQSPSSNNSSSTSGSSQAQPSSPTPQVPADNNNREYGTITDLNGEGAEDIWEQTTSDGHTTIGVGNGTNDVEYGGWKPN
ncbi:MAG: hypothetical protein KC455_11865 [Carnobacterium sp.]|nr:hypothetical protein [Carnobacterium sp.]